MGLSEWLWAPKAMYTVSNMGISALLNFLPVFYEHSLNFSKVQIGFLQTISCVCALVSPPLWGAIADKVGNQRAVHIFCLVTGALLLYMVQYCTTFEMTVLVLFLANFQNAPTGALLDHAVLDLLEKVGGEYGKQRLFGAVGYGTGAYIGGLAVAAAGIVWSFRLSLIFAFLSLFVLRCIPPVRHAHHDGYAELETEGKHTPPKATLMDGLKQLARQVDVLVLFVVVFFMGLMYGVLSSFLTLNLYNLSGNNPQIIGVAIMCETTSELPAFFFSAKIIKKLGTVNVLLMSITGYALRITYYAFMTNAWSAIPFEFLHGVTFGIAWAACTQYVYAAAPKSCQGMVMGMLSAVQNGLGRGVGTLVGSYFYQHYDAKTMWLVTDLGVPLALVGVCVFAYLKSDDQVATDEEEEVVERAELFSPHSGNAKALKSPGFASYGTQE